MVAASKDQLERIVLSPSSSGPRLIGVSRVVLPLSHPETLSWALHKSMYHLTHSLLSDQSMALPVPQPQAPPPPLINPVSVIGAQFLAPHPVDLAVVRKMASDILTEGNFAVADTNGTLIFKVKGKFISIRDRRVMLDAADNPLVTIRPKIMTVHDRWEVFRGESTEDKDLLFSVKRSSVIQLKTKLHVFMANNKDENVCDFRVEGSWLERSCVIYAGESNTIVAQMHKKHTAASILIGKTKFTVTVYPNVDYAFIVALIVILDGINKDDEGFD